MVAIVAPSEPIKEIDLIRITKFFERMGYKVKHGENVLKKIGDYAAGSAADRAADLNWAFGDEEIRAVFAAIGGFVASDTLEQLDFDLIKKNPKIFIGYSDATTLQLPILAKTGLVTYHGPNAWNLPNLRSTGYTISNLWKVLTTPTPSGVVEPQSVWHEVREGKAEGILFGGNLSCVCHLLGTKWDPIVALPKIFGEEAKFLFFWEESYEQFSDIMRKLWHVRNTGFFERVSGMMVGKLTDVKEREYEGFPHKKDLLREVTEKFGFPVLYGVDFGHEVPKATIPIGIKAMMDTKNKKIEILEEEVV